jgi:hypothetical protein
MQERVQQVYGAWAPDHTDGLALTVRPYDPSETYQKIETVHVNAKPSFEMANFLGKAGIGEVAYDKLSASLRDYEVVESVMERHERGQSSLISTLHLKNVLDTASTHNSLFIASGGDPEFAEINDIIANPMMGRLNIGGMAVFKALSVSGHIDLALPYRAAKEYGMDKEARMYVGKRMRDALEERLQQGVAVHWSLPGTRGKQAILVDENEVTVVKRVEDKVANIVIERTPWAVPVPMIVHPGNAELEVLEPRAIESISDVHGMMQEMVDVAAKLSGEQIYYGLPEGARYL